MMSRPLVDSVCLSCPNGALVENVALNAEGDSQGVHITIGNDSHLWELSIDTDAARQLVFRLHGAVMDALRADQESSLRRRAQ